MEKNKFKLYQVAEDIKKNTLVSVNNNGDVKKATSAEINEHYDYQQIVDELVDYCDLNYIDDVIEIIRDTVQHSQEKVLRAMRMHEEHTSKKCTPEKCSCKMKYYNAKVKEQKLKEEVHRRQSNLIN